MGIVFMAMGIASLIGTPVAGALVQGSGGYNGARIWAGVTMIAGSTLVGVARILKTGRRLKVKV